MRERGSHAELVAQRGRYWSMLQEQAVAPHEPAATSTLADAPAADDVECAASASEAHDHHRHGVEASKPHAHDDQLAVATKGDVDEDNVASSDDEEAGIRGISDRSGF